MTSVTVDMLVCSLILQFSVQTQNLWIIWSPQMISVIDFMFACAIWIGLSPKQLSGTLSVLANIKSRDSCFNGHVSMTVQSIIMNIILVGSWVICNTVGSWYNTMLSLDFRCCSSIQFLPNYLSVVDLMGKYLYHVTFGVTSEHSLHDITAADNWWFRLSFLPQYIESLLCSDWFQYHKFSDHFYHYRWSSFVM